MATTVASSVNPSVDATAAQSSPAGLERIEQSKADEIGQNTHKEGTLMTQEQSVRAAETSNAGLQERPAEEESMETLAETPNEGTFPTQSTPLSSKAELLDDAGATQARIGPANTRQASGSPLITQMAQTMLDGSPSQNNHTPLPQSAFSTTSSSGTNDIPSYLLASPASALSSSHYTPLTSSGFKSHNHPLLDQSPLPATPAAGLALSGAAHRGSQSGPSATSSASGASAAAAHQFLSQTGRRPSMTSSTSSKSLAPLLEGAEAQYPSPSGGFVPPRVEERWSLGPVPSKVAPSGVSSAAPTSAGQGTQDDAVAQNEHSEARKAGATSAEASTSSALLPDGPTSQTGNGNRPLSTYSTTSAASGSGRRSSRSGGPPTRPPSLPPSDAAAGIQASGLQSSSRPGSRRTSRVLDGGTSGVSPKGLRPLSTHAPGSSGESRRLSTSASPSGAASNPGSSPLRHSRVVLPPAATVESLETEAQSAQQMGGSSESGSRDSQSAGTYPPPKRASRRESQQTDEDALAAVSSGRSASPGPRADLSRRTSKVETFARQSVTLSMLRIRDFGFPEEDPRHFGARDVSAPQQGGRGGAGAGASGMFAGEAGEEEESAWPNADASTMSDEEEEKEGDDGGPRPGIYSAAYDFQAESEHELTVVSGTRVRVVGALEGGWAIAEIYAENKQGDVTGQEEEGTKRGLVPEAYLEWLEEDT
ncbi:Src homology-3 domain [Ceraceosorus bombacis]|uniref:Src homology-3 domain n=1 Tax=Ceraceosorus bombacis TaxID=401625 RepID=A0A0P1BGW2_9BASI|nr:Src homology-3 domain [Ceraceosorus bombacis]